ncbi:MAG: hypothetical protein M0R51_15040 [Clostridia bacterium]|jgi:hypothetical protein|nr:hypothetical protein [Clostridia bacterium]
MMCRKVTKVTDKTVKIIARGAIAKLRSSGIDGMKEYADKLEMDLNEDNLAGVATILAEITQVLDAQKKKGSSKKFSA